jgi:hypothetical protein
MESRPHGDGIHHHQGAGHFAVFVKSDVLSRAPSLFAANSQRVSNIPVV